MAERGDAREFAGLTPKELDAYLTCELGECGVREYARETGRAPGTVGNQLRWAREKVGGEQA
ncbi:sigma-70 family RNA polymerase sigma factor [Halovenus sp. WSH3]|uniref:Sigma-70 family RNA polymerase sigma factor n=1 Tax=Halovenus carboxidivorans TaxID=2692199 RepID=A0A6B0TAA2_9EURY|nr:sigma-70 family RNA polymerase sigma factor [Halovenus carboxidivorans]